MDSSIKAGQTISVSLPLDTPQNVLLYLDQLKNTGERTYNRKISQLFIDSVSLACSKEKPGLLLPFPEHLSEEQQDWFNQPYTRKMLAKWIFQLLLDPSPSSSPLLSRSLDKPEGNTIVLKAPEKIGVSKEPPQAENHSFEISTSYHSKLVGYFINDD
ncbi:hypothetical protein [Paenibacillus pedocola]|uniref:hypothetical protein n=1 Tax=Paenibacillus pedocola TaxID=3242193 RepID=UPI0028779958|nr:hypothetical protein [Paenibacillus typhae]